MTSLQPVHYSRPQFFRYTSIAKNGMLHSAKQILISELVVALDTDYEHVEQKLSSAI